MLEKQVQEYKACYAPKRFIQKAWVDRKCRVNAAVCDMVTDIVCCGKAHHSPGLVGVCAKALLIEKVAPAPDRLTDEKAGGCNVEHGHQPQLFALGDVPADKYRAYDSAIYRKSAVTEIKELGYGRIGEDDIVKSCADYCAEKAADDCICCSVGVDADLLHLLEAVDKCKHDACCDKKTVPVDLEIRPGYREHNSVDVDARSQNIVAVTEIGKVHPLWIIVQLVPDLARSLC